MPIYSHNAKSYNYHLVKMRKDYIDKAPSKSLLLFYIYNLVASRSTIAAKA